MDISAFLDKFNQAVIENFDSFLASKGFKFHACKKEQYYYSRIYKKNNQYILIDANLNPKDYPYFWNVSLGEGTTEMPEVDWNKIALWHLMKRLENPSAKEYQINDLSMDNIEEAIQSAKNELEKFGKTFLEGDLKIFYAVRKSINQNREPYKIYSRGKDGGLISMDDETSKKLKEKYTK